jgi:hypothetical protein
MRTLFWLFVLGGSLCLISACRAPQTEYRPTATVKDIMDSIVDPSADVLWEAVATTITAAGTEQRAPQTDEEWVNLRRRTVQLIEATNLLLIPGRHVARPGEKAEDPKIQLGPEQIEALINEDRQQWTTRAHGLHDAALVAQKAIEARNAEALLDAGDVLDKACENCHITYWYPRKPAAAPSR